jgi:rubrerythrin
MEVIMDKDKQIEEMLNDLFEFTFGVDKLVLADFLNDYTIDELAEYLTTKKGYRKERQGEWKYNRNSAPYEKLYYCSLCAHGESDYGMDNYCPHCGALMKGE